MSTPRTFRAPPRTWIVVDGHDVEVRVRRSPRARRLRLIVRPAEPVEVVLPKRAAFAEIAPFLAENRRWLEDKVAWARALTERPPTFEMERPDVVWLRGEPIPAVRRAGGRSSATMVGGRLVVGGPDPSSAVHRWYRREARSGLAATADLQAARLDLRYRSISIRDPRTRWGSCSAAGDLSFSWRLILAPPPVLTHVVIHELCHARNPSHGPGFRRALDAAEPGWREWDRWLVDHGHDLRRYVPRV